MTWSRSWRRGFGSRPDASGDCGGMALATPLLKGDEEKAAGCKLGVLSEGFSPDAKVSKGAHGVCS